MTAVANLAETRWLSAAGGVSLFVRHYPTEERPAKRTLLWCHGIAEHGGRYDHVVAEFLARGWQVILPDLRGHGLSEGIRADVSAFEVYSKDFDLIVREFQLDPARTALFGHSMGTLVMTRFAQTRRRNWIALALSSPLLGVAVPIPLWKWWLGQALARIAPRTHLRTGISEDNLTSDPEFLAERHADPLIQNAVTVRWYFAMLSALKKAHSDAAKLTLPILILQGMKDRTTDPHVPAGWLHRTRGLDPRLIEYPDGLHELLNDTQWRAVCHTLLDWLDAQWERAEASGSR